MRRRTYIALAAAGGVAGCLGREDGNEKPEPDDADEDDDPENGDQRNPLLEQRWRERLAIDQVNRSDWYRFRNGRAAVARSL